MQQHRIQPHVEHILIFQKTSNNLIMWLTRSDSISDKPSVCTSPGCVRSSMEILNNVDPTVDPCADFYKFACGNFISNTSLDYASYRSTETSVEDEMNMRMRNILEKPIAPENPRYLVTAKKFFRTCMNVTTRNRNGLGKMKSIFKQMGGWPLQESYWSQGRFKNWRVATHELRKLGINFRLFIDVSVEQHPNHNDKYIVVVRIILDENYIIRF